MAPSSSAWRRSATGLVASSIAQNDRVEIGNRRPSTASRTTAGKQLSSSWTTRAGPAGRVGVSDLPGQRRAQDRGDQCSRCGSVASTVSRSAAGVADSEVRHAPAALSMFAPSPSSSSGRQRIRPVLLRHHRTPVPWPRSAPGWTVPLAIGSPGSERLLTPRPVGPLDRRLPLLSGGARDLPTRQQTLRSAFAWSYDCSPTDERVLFHRLGCSSRLYIESAEVVCADADERGPIAILTDRFADHQSLLAGGDTGRRAAPVHARNDP